MTIPEREPSITRVGASLHCGISEYWIVDPETACIIVLALEQETYRGHGEFGTGDQATSVLLAGLRVDVAAAFAAGRSPR